MAANVPRSQGIPVGRPRTIRVCARPTWWLNALIGAQRTVSLIILTHNANLQCAFWVIIIILATRVTQARVSRLAASKVTDICRAKSERDYGVDKRRVKYNINGDTYNKTVVFYPNDPQRLLGYDKKGREEKWDCIKERDTWDSVVDATTKWPLTFSGPQETFVRTGEGSILTVYCDCGVFADCECACVDIVVCTTCWPNTMVSSGVQTSNNHGWSWMLLLCG